MGDRYRISWEMVDVHLIPRFDGVPNSLIPDQHWHSVSRETDDPWDQYRTLDAWAATGEECVRNVRLERMESPPVWMPVVP